MIFCDSHSEHSVSRLIHLITSCQALLSVVHLNISSYEYTAFCFYSHPLLNISDVLFPLLPHRTLRGLSMLIFEKPEHLNAHCPSVEPALSNSVLPHLKYVRHRLTNSSTSRILLEGNNQILIEILIYNNYLFHHL